MSNNQMCKLIDSNLNTFILSDTISYVKLASPDGYIFMHSQTREY